MDHFLVVCLKANKIRIFKTYCLSGIFGCNCLETYVFFYILLLEL